MKKKFVGVLFLCCIAASVACGAKSQEVKAAGQTTVAAKVKKNTLAASHATAVTESSAASTAAAGGSTAETTSAANETAAEPASTAESSEAPTEALAAETYLCFQSSRYTYGEFQRDLSQLQKQAGSALRVDVLGKTVDGNQLYDLRVGNPEAKHHLLVFGGIHAREYITVQLVMRQTVELLAAQQKNGSFRDAAIRDLLADTEIHLIPMANPDGVSISQLGMDGIHTEAVRETVRNIAAKDGKQLTAGYLQQWKSNANGVDLNRNFDALWESYNDHLGHASADHYKGTTPECEIESKALADLTRQVKFDATLSYHTQGEVIYWNFGQEGALRDMTLALAKRTAELTGYRVDGNFQALDTAGYKDWAISKMGIPSLTIEAGHGGNPVDPAQMESIWRENKDVVPMTLEMIVKGEVHRISETK